MTRNLLPFAVAFALLGLGSTPREADASVRGKTYNVTVTKNLVREFDDFYNFRRDGLMISLRGGVGEWSQINFGMASIWFGGFGAGDIEVSLMGLQMGSTIMGFGSNLEGDIFQAVGTEGPYDGSLEDADTNLYGVD